MVGEWHGLAETCPAVPLLHTHRPRFRPWTHPGQDYTLVVLISQSDRGWSTKASTTKQSTGGHHRCKYPHNRSWSPTRLLLTSPKYLLVLRRQSILTARQRHHMVLPAPRDAGINKQRGWMRHCCVIRMECSDSHINADLTCHEFSAVADLEMRWAEQMPSIGLTHVKAQD